MRRDPPGAGDTLGTPLPVLVVSPTLLLTIPVPVLSIPDPSENSYSIPNPVLSIPDPPENSCSIPVLVLNIPGPSENSYSIPVPTLNISIPALSIPDHICPFPIPVLLIPDPPLPIPIPALPIPVPALGSGLERARPCSHPQLIQNPFPRFFPGAPSIPIPTAGSKPREFCSVSQFVPAGSCPRPWGHRG